MRKEDGTLKRLLSPVSEVPFPHLYEQAAKEWVVWAAFKFMGPEAEARWMYEYNEESVLSALG